MATTYAGPNTGWAYAAMKPGRWWWTHPNSNTASTYAVGLGAVVFQPLWTGTSTRLLGIHAAFATVADTAGNVLKFALYTDNLMMPGNLLVEIPGEMPTTTTRASEGKVLDCDVALTRLSAMWLAYMAVGGTAHPAGRVCNGGHPYMSPGTGAGLTSGYFSSTTSFPPVASASPSGTQVPLRLMVKLG